MARIHPVVLNVVPGVENQIPTFSLLQFNENCVAIRCTTFDLEDYYYFDDSLSDALEIFRDVANHSNVIRLRNDMAIIFTSSNDTLIFYKVRDEVGI